MSIAIEATTTGTFEAVLATTRAALQRHGFGVITEIDLQATFRAKLGAETEAHVILGACQAQSAYAALQATPAADVLLPCNVAVQATPTGVRVAAVDPAQLFELLRPGDAALRELAQRVRDDLVAAVEDVAGAGS